MPNLLGNEAGRVILRRRRPDRLRRAPGGHGPAILVQPVGVTSAMVDLTSRA